jgi:hypothetical protein
MQRGKTALTDANRKKENSFNRCQSEKKKTALIDANRKIQQSKDLDFQTNLLTVF